MNEMRVASIAFAAYFVSSAERMSMKRTGCSARTNGAYSSAMTARARSEATPTTTRSGRMKSSIAAPSFRNSGFETTSNGCARRALQHLRDLLGAADRHGALVHHHAARVMCRPISLGGGEHVLEVRLAVLAGRRAHRDERDLRVPHRVGVRGREGEPPLLHVAADELLEPGLVDRDPARAQHRDLARVDVEAGDRVAGLREAGAGDEADVTGADDGDLHVALPRRRREI